jgi:PmbA protein
MSQEIENAIDHILQSATGLKIEILAAQNESTSISFQSGQMDQFSFSQTHQLGVRVLDGRREGVAYSESLNPGSLDQMLEEARENARMIEKDFIADLAQPAEIKPIPGLYDASARAISMEEKVKAASTLEKAALDFDPAITSVANSRYGDVFATAWIANSRGYRSSYRQTRCFAFARCLAKDGENAVMDGEARVCRGFADLNPRAIAETAARKTLARRGAVRPATGKYTVVFENRVAEDLIGHISDYFSAKAVDEGLSPLKGRIGERVFSAKLTLIDDPFYLAANQCRPFDDEGYASRKTVLVEGGVVRSFLTNSVLARKMNLPHTASASRAPSTDLGVSPSNILVQPGKKSLQDLLASDRKVILVTAALGSAGFRATSGDFSIPVEGHLFENGQARSPLKDFLISGNILNLLGAVEEVGSDALSPVGSIVCPSLLVRDLNISGQT